MTTSLTKNNFDWEYYLSQNPDLTKAGLTTLDQCYRHWRTYGCHEKRSVRSLNKQVQVQVQEPIHLQSIKTKKYAQTINRIIDLRFKVAVMIHVFDVTMLRFFISYANYMNRSYCPENFEFYFNIVEENNPYQGDLKAYVQAQLKQINHPVVECQYGVNRGGDIGGFLLLSKWVIGTGIDYKYAIFIHSKNKATWRKELCRSIFDVKYEHLETAPDIGLISAKKWIYSFDPVRQPLEYRRFLYHMVELCRIYDLPNDKPFTFVAGTMFLAKIEIIQYIVSHEIDHVHSLLNRVDSIDVNWITIMEEMRKDTRGTGNDYQYRLKYNKSLLSDYMIEHTYERVIGLLCQHLGYKLVGAGDTIGFPNISVP